VVRSARRDELQKYLKSCGVNTLVHYPVPPHLQKAYTKSKLPVCSFPLTEAIHKEALSLPMGPHLSASDVTRVVEATLSFGEQK
jgi:dTDP-4-amino-4,6-dideoxygalactose transaminase